MSRACERGTPALFATLLASRPQRTLRVRCADLAIATAVHLVVFGSVVWLSTHGAAAALGYDTNVNTLVLTDHTAVSLHTATASDGAGSATETHAAAPRGATRRAALPLPAAPPLPDLSDVISAVEQQLKAIVDFGIGDELIQAAGAQLAASLARDTVPHIPSVEELEKGVVITPRTRQPELVNRSEIAHRLQERYPRDLIAYNVGGVTALWLLIDKDGKVRKAEVASSSGTRRFDRIALDMVRFMKFQPALNRGRTTPVWVQLPVHFQVVNESG
ncbi:MAG: energy transducer TonB [Gemmatimonadota bacterium]